LEISFMAAEMTTVYVMGSPRGPVKIGIARNPRRRHQAIQTGSAKPVRLLYSREIPAALAPSVEGHAHWRVREHRLSGEWFDITYRVAKEAVDIAVELGGAGPQVASTVGRKRINDEQMPGRFPAGTFARMDAVLSEGEKRSDLLREAVEKELKRRERQKPGKAAEGGE
jgi:Meiotically up-regulated gene 113